MTAGDVVNGMNSVVNTAYMSFQPAAGVEVMLTHFFSTNCNSTISSPQLYVFMYDGTNQAQIARENSPILGVAAKIFINNTRYLRLQNQSGSDGYIGYCGVQLK